MEICFHRNIKSVIIIINFDVVFLSLSSLFNEIWTLLEFEIFFSSMKSSVLVTQKQLVRAWLIAACPHWLNCNRFLQNVRKRKGLVPFNVCQMRAEGKGSCYHSYVTECAEWQGGARGLIGINTCGVERSTESPRRWPVNVSQEKLSTGFEGKQLYLLTEMDFGGNFYKALQQSGEWWEAWSSKEIKTENNNLSTHKSRSVNTGALLSKINPCLIKSDFDD